MNRTFSILLILAVVAVAACVDRDPMSERGFRLPDGDPAAGASAFLYMECNQCHTIAGEELPTVPYAEPPYVELGGEVTKVKTYGELVTAIINPSHRLAAGYAEEVIADGDKSKMQVYNPYMTVQELIDLVMYLQPLYEVTVPDYIYRPYY